MIPRVSLVIALLLAGTATGQVPNRRDLPDTIGPDTVQELTARLMQLQGKLDPKTIEKVLEQIQKNPNLGQEDLLKKIASQQSGLTEGQIEQMLPLVNNPQFLEKIKEMMGKQGLGAGGGFSKEQIAALTQKLNAQAPKVDLPKIDAVQPFANGGPKMPPGKMPDISPTAKNVMEFWEKNFGPLNQSPAVQDAIQKMFASGLNADGTPANFFSFMEQSGYNGQGFANWLNSSSANSGWKWPQWMGGGGSSGSYGGGSWSWGGGGGSSSSSSGGSGGLPEGGSWWSVVLFVLVAGGGLVLWWLWPRLAQGRDAKGPVATAARPDIDPNGVVDRDTLIKVFEGLSLSLIGEDAKVWTHTTLGEALREYLATNPTAADRLALLYALARYTPAAEPFPSGQLQEAKTHLGVLAGVKAE